MVKCQQYIEAKYKTMSSSKEDPIPKKMHVVYLGHAPSQGRDQKIGQTNNIRDRCVAMNTSYSRYTFNIILIIECRSDDESKQIEDIYTVIS